MDMNFLNASQTMWLVPVPPAIAFAVIILFLGRSKALSQITALAGVTISWILGWGLFFYSTGVKDLGSVYLGDSFEWMDLGTKPFRMGVMLDPLTAVMLFMVPFAMLMIFIYSVGYMGAYPPDDPHQQRNSRFFAYLSLFAAAMLTLVVADNLLLLFMGWEVMGLCSYLLIGFLFEKKSAYQAAVKAFMSTRVADVLMLVAIGYLYAEAGTLSFREIFYNTELLAHLATTNAPILGMSVASLVGTFLVIGTIGKAAQFPLHVWLPDAMEGPTPVSAMIHAAAMVSSAVYMVIRMYPLLAAGGDPHHGDYTVPLILMGVVGSGTALFAAVLGVGQNDVKRVLAYSTISQLGFMVAALGIGAYVAAFFHLITHAFFKALLFMSSGAVIHAMEHGEHHAHELAHGHGHGHDHDHEHDDHGHGDEHGHDHDHSHGHGHVAMPGQPYGMLHAFEGEPLPEWNTTMVPDGIVLSAVAEPNDMRNMGGLLDRIPVTALAFLAGGLSLAGFPLLTAGFWSKDEILADALLVGTSDGVYWLHLVVFLSLVIAATFTAFYTGRQWLLTFWGKPRSDAARYATLMSGHHVDDEKLASQPPFLRWQLILMSDDAVDEHLRGRSVIQRFLIVYRDSFPMQLPLVLLAFFALTAGFVGIHPDFPIFNFFTGDTNYFHDFIHQAFPTIVKGASGEFEVHAAEAPDFNLAPVAFSFLAALGGLGLAFWVYGVEPLKAGEVDPVQKLIGDKAWTALQNRFYIDELYLRLFVVPFEWFGRRFTYEEVDKKTIDELWSSIGQGFVYIGEAIKRFNYVVIDGVSDGIPIAIGQFSRWFRSIQSGRTQQYMLFGALALLLMGTLLVLQSLF
jgi:NADH-quinone oxidoreductase subunit L